ncbi:hypothetical protein BU23DRAFT_604305 [Bimuria novae-zelandiae CBS 107.79]|uniref:Uncharacterized protein n=1 Tax=Bimuria novae-zelandiae CBS 107.79 TaxID=1447943 RepID=A0A6A5UK51_9PLEO|nr:hypothetical protein BU23DRAFT_604305 [Bimuria novae-zelandiae CBS 107.79]
MDSKSCYKAILEETLSNDEAILELFTSKAAYAGSVDENPALFHKVGLLFEKAILDAKQAHASQEPVIKILKKVLVDVGRVQFKAKKTEEAAAVAIKNAVQQKDPPLSAVRSAVREKNASAETKTKDGKAAARQSARSGDQVTRPNVNCKHDSPQTGKRVTRPLPRPRSRSRSISPSGGFGSFTASSKSKHPPARKLIPSAASIAAASVPSTRVSPPAPKKTTPKRKNASPAKVSRKRRKTEKDYKSEAIVRDSDESDVDMPRRAPAKGARDVEDLPDYVDLSEGLGGFEYRDEDGKPAKRPHGRQAIVKGAKKEALIVKLKLSPGKLQAKIQELQSGTKLKTMMSATKKTVQEQATTAKSREATNSTAYHQGAAGRTSLASSELGLSPEDPESILRSSGSVDTADDAAKLFLPSPAASHLTDHGDSSWEEVSDTEFLPFPEDLTRSHLPHFMKGLQLAIENIITDYQDDPNADVLGVVKELQENSPIIPAGPDDRHLVLRGRKYVYDAVDQIRTGRTSPSNDFEKDSGVDLDGDVDMFLPPDVFDSPMKSPAKVHYKGKGRAWKKVTEDADPDFKTQSRSKVSDLPQRAFGRRKTTRSEHDAKKQGIKAHYDGFCAHVKQEYRRTAESLGVEPEWKGMPTWMQD